MAALVLVGAGSGAASAQDRWPPWQSYGEAEAGRKPHLKRRPKADEQKAAPVQPSEQKTSAPEPVAAGQTKQRPGKSPAVPELATRPEETLTTPSDAKQGAQPSQAAAPPAPNTAESSRIEVKPKIEIVPQIGHSSQITSVAFSPDGARMLSGSTDKTVKLWDVATGALLRTFKGHSDLVNSVSFSPDGTRVLSGSDDNTMKLWDAASDALLRTFVGHSRRVWSVAFSPDGARVLSGSEDDTTKLWDADTGRLLHTFEGWSRSVAFSPDGARVLSGSGRTVKLWDAASGQLIGTIEDRSSINSVAFSPDGTRVLSGGSDSTVKLWEAASGVLLRTFWGHAGAVYSVGFSPDGARVLSGGEDGTLKLWDAATGRLLRTLGANSGFVRSLAFSPDGTRVLLGGDNPTVKLWDAATGALLRTFGQHSYGAFSFGISSVAFSPDGTRVLSGSDDKTLKLWDAASGQLIRTLGGREDTGFGMVLSVAFSPDGARALSSRADGTQELWDVATGALVRTFKGDSGEVNTVAFSPDGTRLLSGGNDKTVKLWDAISGALLRTFEGHSGEVHTVVFSPDGTRLISGSYDNTLKLWDVATGALLHTFEGHSGEVDAVAFSPDGGRVLSGSDDKTVKLWDVATGALVRTFEGHSGEVDTVAFSPDGTRVLSGSDDNTLKLWDAATGALLRTFEGHAGGVNSVAFSPDGARVLSGSVDTTMRMWSVRTGELLASMIGERDGEWLTITPNGFFVASPRGSQALAVVRGLKVCSINQFFRDLYSTELVEEALKGDPEGKYKDAAYKLDLEKVLDSGPAPQLELLEKKTELAGGTVRLTVRITDTGGGIGGRLEWRVKSKSNPQGQTQGRVQPDELKGLTDFSVGRAATVIETLKVDPSRPNTIEVAAYNGKEMIATAPLSITVDVFGATTEERPHMYVLAIGVDKYKMKDYELHYAAEDADSFAKALKVVGSGLFADVRPTVLKNEQVTASAIGGAFEQIGASAKPSDVFVLFLGGHGKSVEGRYYYYPQSLDFAAGQTYRNGIGQDQWQEWLAKIPAQKTLLILDTCESGAAGGLIRGASSARQTAMDQFQHAIGQNLVAAAGSSQSAIEGYKGHGVLTYAVLEALNKKDGETADEEVGVGMLADYADKRVPAITQSVWGVYQKPVRKLAGNDFPIGIRAAGLTDMKPEQDFVGTGFILLRDERVRESPKDDAAAERMLDAATFVDVVKFEGEWALIAIGGQKLGYVPAGAVKKPH